MKIAVRLAGEVKKVKQLGPYSNCGDMNHIRTHLYFDVPLEINGKPLNGTLELQKREDSKNRPLKGCEPGWSASIRMNIDVGSEHGPECLECGGCWGRSQPETSGDTARAISPVIQDAMKILGYVISTKYANIGIFSAFVMQVEKAKELGVAHGRFGWNYTIGTIEQITCPVHGVMKQKNMECDCD